ncbi:alpha/beta fold hydrolase [Pseudonocardia spinosispora]|uniref:alpha/beta fold hydrolase n=1 Tax=Pseudonocardia spinosispora TaxID=103441 RepID=UPI0003FD3B26|nr:alpha/beta hydrolase [Pseudonocardia spinosispora]
MSGWKVPATVAGGVVVVAAIVAVAVSGHGGHDSSPTASPDAPTAATVAEQQGSKPTVVLVSGAFEDSSSWSGEIMQLQRDGYPVIAPAVPLRGIASDTAYLNGIVRNIHGPVVLAGHSLGGIEITEVAAQNREQVKALVYAAALIPDAGETAQQLLTQFPGSLFGPTTTYAVSYPGGAMDTYVKPSSFQSLFAGDRAAADAAVAAAIQRPVAGAALGEPAAAGVPGGIPVFAIVANQDMAIPPAAERFEAERAKATITMVNSAHDLPSSHPGEVIQVIEHAAQ